MLRQNRHARPVVSRCPSSLLVRLESPMGPPPLTAAGASFCIPYPVFQARALAQQQAQSGRANGVSCWCGPVAQLAEQGPFKPQTGRPIRVPLRLLLSYLSAYRAAYRHNLRHTAGAL